MSTVMTIKDTELRSIIIEALNERGYTAKPENIIFSSKGCTIYNVQQYLTSVQRMCTHMVDNKDAFYKTGVNEYTCTICGYIEKR